MSKPLLALLTLALLAATPHGADAQLRTLKRLKNAVSPDSATKAAEAAKDSADRAAKLAAGDTTAQHRSLLSRAASTAAGASQKLESATGVSTKELAKDAVLNATGMGAANLVAKKLGGANAAKAGYDPMSMLRMTTGGSHGVGGMPSLGGLGAGMGRPNGSPKMEGISDADQKMMQDYTQEMMRVTTAASAGDASAQARLQQMSEIAAKYQAEMQTLSVKMAGGDMASMQRMQTIQFDIIREWLGRK